MTLGALILMGGRSRRMGVDKARLDWDGRSAAQRCEDLARAIGAVVVVRVGGEGEVPDDHPGGGPVGGVMAGARALRASGCDRALVLAVDAPTIRAADLQALLDAPQPGAAFEGLHLPMVVALDALPLDAEAGWPVGRLIERTGLARLAPPQESTARLRGANTPEERNALLADQRAAEGAQQSGGG